MADDADEVGLLERARVQGAERDGLLSFGLDPADPYPLDVPLHDLDWGSIRFTTRDGGSVRVAWVEVQHPCVGRDAAGRRFLARRGDLLVRDGHGNYALLKVVRDA